MNKGKLYTNIISSIKESGATRTEAIEILEVLSKMYRRENSFAINLTQMGRVKVDERPDTIQMKVEGN